jgi:hypothetical protein
VTVPYIVAVENCASAAMLQVKPAMTIARPRKTLDTMYLLRKRTTL